MGTIWCISEWSSNKGLRTCFPCTILYWTFCVDRTLRSLPPLNKSTYRYQRYYFIQLCNCNEIFSPYEPCLEMNETISHTQLLSLNPIQIFVGVIINQSYSDKRSIIKLFLGWLVLVDLNCNIYYRENMTCNAKRFRANTTYNPNKLFRGTMTYNPNKRFRATMTYNPNKLFQATMTYNPNKLFRATMTYNPNKLFRANMTYNPNKPFRANMTFNPNKIFRANMIHRNSNQRIIMRIPSTYDYQIFFLVIEYAFSIHFWTGNSLEHI